MNYRNLFGITLIAAAALPLAAQLPGLPPPPPNPIEVVRQFMKIEPARMVTLQSQVKAPEIDLPNALWVASRAHVSPEVVIQSRLSGLNWMDIFLKYKVPVVQVIVPVQQASCPPYGKAWGYYRKHGGRRGAVVQTVAEEQFTDAEIADFINLRAVSGVYRIPINDLAVRRCGGKDIRGLIVEEDEKKHGKGHGDDHDGDHGNEGNDHKGKKQGKGHEDKDHGNDHPSKDKGHGKGHGGKDK